MTKITISDVRCAEYSIDMEIHANSNRIWRALFAEINHWWLPDFHMLGTESVVSFEPRAGGLLLEKNGDRELAWYTVVAIDPQQSVTAAGYCTGEYGGPSTSLLTIRLKPNGEQTLLTIKDELIGKGDVSQANSLLDGWTQLFTDGLKRWVESDS